MQAKEKLSTQKIAIMNKQFWITFKQFMLYLLLSQGIMAAGAIATVIKGGMNGIKGDALMDYIFSSKITI